MSDAPPPVTDAVLDDLRARVRVTRRVAVPDAVSWQRGTDPDYLTSLLASWSDDYDWRPHEERIRALPWVRTSTSGAVRSIHRRSEAPDAAAVVLLHGWPDSVLRFERLLPLLDDLHVVVPALPGYPFAETWSGPPTSTSVMAEAVAGVMEELGYERYVVSGGDIGSSVPEGLAVRHPARVSALHLTDVPYRHMFTLDEVDLTDSERTYLAAGRQWQLTEGAYALEQSTKPRTLAVGLGDSPAGLAAWIVEKLRSWSDCGGDVESVFSREDLLTWVTAYWVSGAIGTSFTPYTEEADPVGRVEVPTVVTMYPMDLVPAPREFGERFFDLRVWDERPDGGHFGAWERPEAYAAGVRSAVDLLRN
jgi:pimeloyl-ACP methyl ester carboxylesterase